jgi:hypothetical protein
MTTLNMELSQHEIDKFMANDMEADKRRRQRNKRRQEIEKKFNSSKLPDITPIWHTNNEDIDLSKQTESLRDDLLEDGFTIIENVDIELLFDKMSSGNPAMFREKILYNLKLGAN